MPFIPRMGRPGLLGLAARTAVVAGTATAVSGGMMAHRQKKAQTEFEASQYEAAQQHAAQYEVGQYGAAGPQVAAAAPPVDLVAELQKLGDLKTQGLLSDVEFEAAKARLLA
jgi:hypothetical protein